MKTVKEIHHVRKKDQSVSVCIKKGPKTEMSTHGE